MIWIFVLLIALLSFFANPAVDARGALGLRGHPVFTAPL